MKKKLAEKDLSKVVKAKFVKLLLGNQYNSVPANRYYFNSDPQLDRCIIVGIQAHPAQAATNPGPNIVPGEELPFYSSYNPAISYEDDYYSCITTNIATGIQSQAYLSLVNPEGRYFWYQQPIASLTTARMGSRQKKLYSRIQLDKCYLEFPAATQFSIPGLPITVYQCFTFYYMDDKNL